MSDFVGLHVHGQHSFLDGYASVEQIAQRTVELGQKAVALTDHQEVGAHLMFLEACERAEIKPILGMEGYLVDSYQQAVAEKYMPKDFSHVTLLAKNNNGLRNLWAWSSDAYINKRYRRALQDWDGIAKYGQDIYASDGCLLAWMARAILADDEDRCHELMGRYLNAFGDNFFMELHTFQFMEAENNEQRDLNAQMTKVNQGKVALATQYGVPLVVVNDSHYAQPEEWENHNIVWEMSTGKNDDQTGRGQCAAHMMGDDELVFWMARHGVTEKVTREAIAHTAVIAEACNVSIEPKLRMPRVTESSEEDNKLFLKQLEAGFERKIVQRGLDVERYHERLEYEAKLILEKDFAGYFNVVADYTKHAKSTMLLGPGRGSGGGSLCTWLMDITEVDPIKYGLPFERFLNPDRKGLPDIDLDFPQSKRPQVKIDLGERFGHDRVVTIGTVSTLGPKGILKDLARIWKIDWNDSTEMSKIFDRAKSNDPDKTSMTWDEIMEQLAEPMAPYVVKYPRLFQKMSEMVGMIRGSSSHASGILISTEDLEGILPIRVTGSANSKALVSAWTMNEVEKMGFVKFDVLGLRHLDTVEMCLKLIEERHGVTLDLYGFDDEQYSDPDIWTEIHRGDTTGIFQLETADMTKVAKRFKPNNEVEVADLISANRPGVIYAKQLEPFLLRREGLEAPSFQNPMTEKHLQRTFGIIVLQEQIMEIVKDLAGFTPGQADSVRSAVGKKKQAELDKFHEQFVDGCLANPVFCTGSETGDPRADAENIWRSIKASGSYAFSIVHATEYAIISSWEVWLRHYYYPEFLTALLSTDAKKEKDEPPKTAIYMRHARMRGLDILGPDINESRGDFRSTDNGVRYGFNFIKGIGDSTTKRFLPMQPFTSFDDFLERTNVNRGAIFTMIKIGAFDSFGEKRHDLWMRFRDILIHGTPTHKKLVKAAREKVAADPIPSFGSRRDLYEIEKDLTGSFVTEDPMAPYVHAIEQNCLSSPEELEDLHTNQTAIVGGQITRIKEIVTKRGKNPGQKMAFLDIEWNYQIFNVTVFPHEYARYRFLDLKEEVPVAVRVTRLLKGCCASEVERLDWIFGEDN